LAALHDVETGICVAAERAMNARLQGGCQVPIAGFAILQGSELFLRGLVGSPDGKVMYRSESTGRPDQAETLGRSTADDLLNQGADTILQNLFSG
jgi:hydroxymethylbilane synthase